MTCLKRSQVTEWKESVVHQWEHAGLRYNIPGTSLLYLPAVAAGLTWSPIPINSEALSLCKKKTLALLFCWNCLCPLASSPFGTGILCFERRETENFLVWMDSPSPPFYSGVSVMPVLHGYSLISTWEFAFFGRFLSSGCKVVQSEWAKASYPLVL